MLYLAGTAIYIIGKRDKLAGLIVAITLALLLLLLQLGLWYNADLLLGVFGKDSTLTGRTDIWLATLDLIKQKPLLGWGYMATWVPTDPQTAAIWEEFRWPVPNAHNAYLDVTLQLGLVGLGLLLTIIAVAWQRAQACCKRGVLPLGWFSLMFIAGALLYEHFGNWAGTKSKHFLAASKCLQLQLRIKTSISRQARPISGSAPP